MRLEDYATAAHDCSEAIELDGAYIKAYLRRSAAFECLEDYERALADVKKILELDPKNSAALAIVGPLEKKAEARREEMKEEMVGKLKELGNVVLGKFGLSIDNFKAEKDPETGSYSIKFQQ